MRLIDADRLKSYIDCGHLRPSTELCFTEIDVCNMVDKQPTIDGILTERIATWIDRGDYAVCSWCAGTSWQQMNGVEHIPFKSKYCPTCGAKMGE